MPWNKNDYPASMKNLPDKQRDKAIEIANSLLEDGYEEERAIPIAISTSEKWADNRASIPSSKEMKQSKGHKKETSEALYHILPNKEEWIIRKTGSKRQSFSFDTKQEALDKAKYILKNTPSRFIVHKKDGSFEKVL